MLLAVLSISVCSFQHNPDRAQENRTPRQHSSVAASGYFCDNNNHCNGSFAFNFNPQGGPVSGSFYIQIPILHVDGSGQQVGVETFQGSLTGNFAGGDGGLVSGTLTNATKNMHFTVACDGCTDYTESRDGRSWQGNLFASGEGNGWISSNAFPWYVSFSADAFGSTNPTATEEPDVPAFATIEADMNFEEVEWIPFTSVTESLHTWVEMDQLVLEMLGQDGALVAREIDGTFYVIDNSGQKKAIPPELIDALQIENGFALLGNQELLLQNPTIQALIQKEGEEVINTITGTGDVQFYKPPDWLKRRQYFWIMTQCYEGVCCGYSRISLLKSSGYVSTDMVASSEHGSVRGTINGTGDFIYTPNPMLAGALLLSLFPPQQQVSFPAYLGAQVFDSTNGAEVRVVQTGSPADLAGLKEGDLIISVSGRVITDQKTLASRLEQYQGGDEITLAIVRNNENLSLTLDLAEWIPPIFETPSAMIYSTDGTTFVYDIGMNGITAVLVTEGLARVVEPVTNTQVDLQAGQVIIVVPEEPIGTAFTVSESEINKWWERSETTVVTSTVETPESSQSAIEATSDTALPPLSFLTHREFNPLPNADEEDMFMIFAIGCGILYLVILLILLIKK